VPTAFTCDGATAVGAVALALTNFLAPSVEQAGHRALVTPIAFCRVSEWIHSLIRDCCSQQHQHGELPWDIPLLCSTKF